MHSFATALASSLGVVVATSSLRVVVLGFVVVATSSLGVIVLGVIVMASSLGVVVATL